MMWYRLALGLVLVTAAGGCGADRGDDREVSSTNEHRFEEPYRSPAPGPEIGLGIPDTLGGEGPSDTTLSPEATTCDINAFGICVEYPGAGQASSPDAGPCDINAFGLCL